MKRCLVFLLLTSVFVGCSKERPKTRLIYFGFDARDEKPEDVIRLTYDWGKTCPQWQPTTNRARADYQILFGDVLVTLLGPHGEILYNGGIGPMYLPNGNPDGSGVNICKLTEH